MLIHKALHKSPAIQSTQEQTSSTSALRNQVRKVSNISKEVLDHRRILWAEHVQLVEDDIDFQLRMASALLGKSITESPVTEEGLFSEGFCINQTVRMDQQLHCEEITGLPDEKTDTLDNRYYNFFSHNVKANLDAMHAEITSYPERATFIVTAEPKVKEELGHVMNAIKVNGEIKYINVYEGEIKTALNIEQLRMKPEFSKYDGEWGYFHTGMVGNPRQLAV